LKAPIAARPPVACDRASEVFAPRAGLALDDVRHIWAAVEQLYRSGAYPAVAFCLRRQGCIVLNRTIGVVRRAGAGEPERDAGAEALTPATPICLFSASKAVVAILIHKLAEQGGIDLDRAVAHYLPQFAQAGKGGVTVADVLAHRSGFPTIALPKAERRVEVLEDWPRIVDLICRAPQTHGRQFAYHAITGGFILAEVLQRVTGQSLRQYLDQELRQPLQMTHFTYGLPPPWRERAAVNYAAGAKVGFPMDRVAERALLAPFEQVVAASNSPTFMDAVIPSGNLFATAEELSRFFQMLLDGGLWQGRRILQPETVARAIRPVGRWAFDRTLMIPMRFSEGLMLGAASVGLFGPRTAQAYGHLGFMNILGWADPQRDISVGLLTTGKAMLGAHLLPLSRLLATLSRRCGKV
jgi:CubicO group peptidase (beta-lactamase class C family)